MAGTLNKVMLIGNTGDDVKMHYFEGGGMLGRFPLATSETYTNRSTNERVTNTEWHNIVVRNKGAEICEKYLKKGDKVYIEGRIKTRKWQDDKGNDRYTTEIHCTEFTFLTPKGESDNSGGYSQQQNSPAQNQQNTAKNDNFAGQSMAKEEEEDDLPF
ncbi:single-strand binding protein [Salegentibacter echinorum]|uniref:Single-stranded DNA-binding protein n=1 Tax=Salegentibacter echinorum TaxID=1073325 RepID=A0A1M5G5E0_SALEC|nr:single-stranded DNA-binding protein [Salegentibacter echinorum]SHF99050.1 single-strand binding protein [Salegentibacter echinorum]